MFEVGFSEVLVIFALSLIVLGPEKLPKLAQQVGKWVGRARAMARQFRDQLEEEAHNLETKMNIDPGVDTSLDPRAGPAAPHATPAPEAKEEFYPPDHHMHSSHAGTDVVAPAANAAPDSAAPHVQPSVAEAAGPHETGAQGELNLTSPPADGSRSAP